MLVMMDDEKRLLLPFQKLWTGWYQNGIWSQTSHCRFLRPSFWSDLKLCFAVGWVELLQATKFSFQRSEFLSQLIDTFVWKWSVTFVSSVFLETTFMSSRVEVELTNVATVWNLGMTATYCAFIQLQFAPFAILDKQGGYFSGIPWEPKYPRKLSNLRVWQWCFYTRFFPNVNSQSTNSQNVNSQNVNSQISTSQNINSQNVNS